MQSRRVEKNVDLKLLMEHIESFFTSRGFKIAEERSESKYEISAIPQHGVGMLGRVIVRVLEDSNDFLIEFSTSSHSRSAVKLGLMTTMFGGGSLVLRGLKSREALEKLEKDFWIYVDEAITRLIKSAG